MWTTGARRLSGAWVWAEGVVQMLWAWSKIRLRLGFQKRQHVGKSKGHWHRSSVGRDQGLLQDILGLSLCETRIRV